MSTQSFDLVVIGGGPGGYVAAIRAAQLKMKVALVESTHLGGICLNWGCIPTKALLRSAEIYRMMQHAEEFGLQAKGLSMDITKIVARSRAVSAKLAGGIQHLMKKNAVTVIEGRGALAGKSTVSVEKDGVKTTLNAKHIIIATGARARVLPGFEPDGKHIWTYREAMVPESFPARLVIVGSGAIGIEFASFYRTLGAEVTVIEAQDRILPVEDAEISAIARQSFEKQGIVFHVGATLKGCTKKGSSITIQVEVKGKEQSIVADRVIMAVGIVANTEGLNLEKTAVKLDRNHIVTNQWMETAEKGVYAIGDVAGAPWLAHKASHEATLCVEKIAGLPVHAMNKQNIPGCTYSHPQIASVGLTEAQAKEKGHTLKIGRFPFMANGKAIALGETEGLIKTIWDAKNGELLGAHMVGAEVTEMIQGFVIAKNMECTEEDLMHTIFAYPTLSEMMHESVLDAFGRAIHM